MTAYLSNYDIAGVSHHVTDKTPKIAFLFTDQGSQYANIEKQLYETEPLFRANIQRCEGILNNYLDISLEEILDSEALNKTAYFRYRLLSAS